MMDNVEQYIKNVRKLFELSSKHERLYLKDLRNRLIDYSEKFTDATYSDYIEHFGEPKDILISYYEYTNTDLLIKRIKIRKYLVSILIIMTILSLIFSTIIFINYLEGRQSYIDREEVLIVENQ